MYEVGDRVQLNEKGVKVVKVSGEAPSEEAKVGTTGTVQKANSPHSLLVRLDVSDASTNGHEDGWWLLSDEIEPISSDVNTHVVATHAVTRFVGAEFGVYRFERRGDEVAIIAVDSDTIATITIDELRAVMVIIDRGE